MPVTPLEGTHYDIDPRSACWMWKRYRTRAGYGRMGREGRLVLAHRIMYEDHVGPIPEGLLVLHRCDNPPCVNPEHLFLGTHTDNYADMRAKGRERKARGAEKPNAKLTEEQAREIVEAFENGTARRGEFARKFGVSKYLVHDIKRGKTWRHLRTNVHD